MEKKTIITSRFSIIPSPLTDNFQASLRAFSSSFHNFAVQNKKDSYETNKTILLIVALAFTLLDSSSQQMETKIPFSKELCLISNLEHHSIKQLYQSFLYFILHRPDNVSSSL